MKGSTLAKNSETIARQPSDAAASAHAGLSKDELVAAYRVMLLSRRLDDKEIQLKNQSLIYFQISGAGHEAVLVAAAAHLKAGYDWFYPYYRDRALCLALGMTPLEMLLGAVGSTDDPNSGGRQMPSHWGHRALNIPSQGSPTGTQCLQAIGCGEAGMIYGRVAAIPDAAARQHDDEITYVSVGDGATSEGEFWESLNTACTRPVPALYLVEDNGYAISVPVEVQTPGGDISRLVESFPNLKVLRCDGTDFLDSYRVLGEAVAWVRRERKPAFVHAKVTRPYSHSLSDDERLYKTPQEREAEAARDPLVRMRAFLLGEGLATEADLAAIADVGRTGDRPRHRRRARGAEGRRRHRRRLGVLARRRSDLRRLRHARDTRRASRHDGGGHQPHAQGRDGGQSAHRRLRRGRRRRQPHRHAGPGAGQGRRLQGDARPAARLRRRPRLQLAAGRGQHRRPRRRHGAARPQAGGRDPVLRLHLAGDDADQGRDVDDALSLGQQHDLPDGDPRADRRLPARRRAVPQPVGGEHLRALPRHPHRLPVQRHRRRRAASHVDPLRRSGDVLRAQAPLSADLQQGRLSRRRTTWSRSARGR